MDLKPDNVFLGKDGVFKIGDLGSSVREDTKILFGSNENYLDQETRFFRQKYTLDELNNLITKTSEPLPEEVKNYFNYDPDKVYTLSKANDLFAFGLIIYRFFYRETPFKFKPPLITPIIKGDTKYVLKKGIDSDVAQIIMSCLTIERTNRMTAQEVMDFVDVALRNQDPI